MEYLVYTGGTAMGFAPLVISAEVHPMYFSIYMALSFFSALGLYLKLDEKTRPILLYLPFVFNVLSVATQVRRPRIGIALTMLSILCVFILMIDSMIEKQKDKIFKDEINKNFFRFQIMTLMFGALYMFNGLVRIANIARSVTK